MSHVFVGIKFLIPTVKIALVDAALGEEIGDVHEELLVGVFHVGNDGNFLTICGALEKKFWEILWLYCDKKVIMFSPSGEEIGDVHEELLVGVFHIGNDGDFLTICASLEKKFWGILWVVW